MIELEGTLMDAKEFAYASKALLKAYPAGAEGEQALEAAKLALLFVGAAGPVCIATTAAVIGSRCHSCGW